MGKQIICVGSASKDVFFPLNQIKVIDNAGDIEVKKLIAFESGAKIHVENRYEAPGGCAANASQGLSRLGVEAACYSRIGKDFDGDWIVGELKKEKVEIDLIQKDEKNRTDLSMIIVNQSDAERTIFFNRDANEKLILQSDEIVADWLFVSALNGQVEEHFSVLSQEIDKKHIQLAFNPGQENITHNIDWVKKFIAQSAIVFVNLDEAIEICDGKTDKPEELLEKLISLGAKAAVITDGTEGSYASYGQKKYFAQATKENPVDLTGAGDAFAAAFLAGHIKGLPFEKCMQWGAANGGSVVNFYGAQRGLLNEEEIIRKAESVQIKTL